MQAACEAGPRPERQLPEAGSRRPRRAFTFVEVMVAVVVLVLGFLPVYSMMESGIKRARFQKIRAFALSLGQSYLERTRACSLMFLDADGPEAEAGAALGVPNFWANDPATFIGQDALLNPKAGENGVPGDPEMAALLARYDQRAENFLLTPGRTSPNWEDRLGPMGMRIHTISVSWGQGADEIKVPENLQEFREGKNGRSYLGSNVISLAAITGEGLFHPPPALEVQ